MTSLIKVGNVANIVVPVTRDSVLLKSVFDELADDKVLIDARDLVPGLRDAVPFVDTAPFFGKEK